VGAGIGGLAAGAAVAAPAEAVDDHMAPIAFSTPGRTTCAAPRPISWRR
jgi:hypothetical protein